ncbi:MAG: VWA domain-containing protein [Rhizobiales bacterium 65-9]|nr:VWA domain-containing protein [Hyphomicrobiales bacterium]OJY34363.1 MAG: VWA domain-containing protein [Rhizobiales bacterium 65-9]
MTGRLAENIAYFGRALRQAGLPVGPGAVVDAIHAVEAARIGNREDFYWTLHAVFVKRREHMAVFDQAFRLFWRRRAFLDKLMAMLSPMALARPDEKKPEAGARRAAEALSPALTRNEPPEAMETQFEARLTMSDAEILKGKDFAQMSAAEIAEAERAIARLRLPFDRVRTRRFVPSHDGRIDPRRTFRRSLRAGGDIVDLAFHERAERHPPLVALCDISGSMADYTRVFLHFLHAIMDARRRVHAFVFATRLTNITRELRAKDPDEALAAAALRAQDWEGGTRLGACIHAFNRDWSRRVLGQGATVLFFSDGLERQNVDSLRFEMDRLRRSARRVVWLNPLLRFDGFEAKAEGIRAILPFVDEMRPIHNLSSMADLAAALSSAPDGRFAPRRWLAAAA